jgi:hypothetical protein
MPSRKQRRRREKLKRHEYEYVVETEEGEEVVVERPTAEPAKNGTARSSPAPRDRRGREVPKPSLQRLLRRTALFAPLIFVFVWLTSPDEPTVTKVSTVALLIAFFMPFSYLVDAMMYRILQRRQERSGAGRG